MKRCTDTLEPILAHFPSISPVLDPRLREKSSGIFEGRPIGLADIEAEKLGQTIFQYRPPGGENWADVKQRASSFLQDLIRTHISGSFQRILVVSHSIWIIVFWNIVREMQGLEFELIKTKNTSLYIFEFSMPESLLVNVLLEGDTSHLVRDLEVARESVEVESS